MAVPVGVAKIQYFGTGSAGPFAFNFVLYDQTHLKITRTSLLGVDTVLALTTDYSVTIAGDNTSATVTLVVPLAGTGLVGSSEKLTIVEDPPISQLVEWSRNDPFPFQTHQRAADLAVLLIGRLSEKISRSLLLPESSSFSGLTLPDPVALNFLQWNAGGTALQNQNLLSPGLLVVSPFIQTLLDDTTAAAARATLGAGTGNGDTTGPAGATANRIATFNGGTGKILQDGGALISDIDPRGKQSIWVPATAMYIATGSAGPSTGQINVGGAVLNYLAFDPTSQEFAYFSIATPKSWNAGTLTAEFFWVHPATATNFGVAWQVGLASFADNVAITNSYVSQAIVDTGGTTNNLYRSTETSALDPGNTQAKQDLLAGFATRISADGNDTLAVDAFLIGVMLHYTTNAPTDA